MCGPHKGEPVTPHSVLTCIPRRADFFAPGWGEWMDETGDQHSMDPRDVYHDGKVKLTNLLERCFCMQVPDKGERAIPNLDEGLDVSLSCSRGLPPSVLCCIPPVALVLLRMRSEYEGYSGEVQQSKLRTFLEEVRPLGRLLAIALHKKLVTVEQLVEMNGVSTLFGNPNSRAAMWVAFKGATERHIQSGKTELRQFNRTASQMLARAFSKMLKCADGVPQEVSVALVILLRRTWLGGLYLYSHVVFIFIYCLCYCSCVRPQETFAFQTGLQGGIGKHQ
jgi:hypothetical protein